MTIKTASKKNKGRKLQHLVRDLILASFPDLTEDDVRSTSMGAQGEDVQLSPKARERFPYQVECKARKSMAIYPMYEQAAKHGTHPPLLVVKQDRKDPLVIIGLADFISLIRRNNNGSTD